MIPQHYFEIICCPKCRSNFDKNSKNEKEVSCHNCKSTYPVIQGIPILLPVLEDEVGQVVKRFYDSEWRRNEAGVLKAKVKHEDLSNLGQLYIKRNEARFVSLFKQEQEKDQNFFLDAGSGAQPRVEFGKNYSYHICLDFSLEGLIESRKLLGSRAICICGSILNMPIKDSVCDGVIASHVIYHIEKDLQVNAIQQLSRVLRPGSKLLILYANPNSLERLLIKGLKKMMRRKETATSNESTFYYYAHSVNFMLDICSNEFGNSNHYCPVKLLGS
ncbi:class I SAM-dependent methyltransferase [Acidobacteria bacterium AH-259-A15]|nr:class I SAM-dependent methyltransferase [Acidobacteria bacterium AH-259-A15]